MRGRKAEAIKNLRQFDFDKLSIHKKLQKFAKNHDRNKVLPSSKINDGNDLTI